MADDNNTNDKPKVTLIKHPKTAEKPKATNEEPKKEKKKVVIVRKKVKKKVVVHAEGKPAPKEAVDDPNTTAVPESKVGSPIVRRAKESGDNKEFRPSPREFDPINKGKKVVPKEGAGNRRSQPAPRGDQPRGFRQRTDNRQPGGQGRPGGFNRQGGGPAGGRPGGGFNRGGQGGRPGGPGPNRTGGGFRGKPGGGNRPGGGPPQQSAPVGKGSAPKKFRSKKEKAFIKEREEREEKAYQFSKKKTQVANPVPKSIEIMEVITVAELARKMNLKASDLIGKLMGMGMMVTINQQIDAETATILASEFGADVKIVSLYDETIIEMGEDKKEELEHRPPIVTVMGHVDHGKTKTLDAIRTTNIVDGEHGGITQHIGAYMVETPKGQITFLDTPGHEAFTLMRARGAQVTDIVVLVVAANDGVMPQTIEAIRHAKDAKVPIIVAINKVDLPEANPDRVKQQLSEYDLVPEEWGGSTMYVEISALKRQGLDNLLESILLQAEVMELVAVKDRRAEGKVIESKIDQGRGVVATVLVERGTLSVGDSFVGGIHNGKVRALFDDRGEKVDSVGPSMPVEILGFTGVPDSGDPFQVTQNERQARQIGGKRQELKKHEEAKNVKKITLDNLYDSIQDGAIQDLKVIIKGDVHGSVEALQNALEKLSNKDVRLTCISASAGAIVESDVYLASASNAIIVGFHVRPTPKAQLIADQEKVEIKKYNIIYDAVEDIRSAMEGLLAPDLKEVIVGTVEVRDVFKVPKIGMIAGCFVTDGKITRNSSVHVYREGVEIHTGKVNSLKRFKDDAKEVTFNYECGVGIDGFLKPQVGDVFEVFEIHEIARKLEDSE
jgi:translation initiation factor IF-2